jgi:hypothetical protein
MPATKGSAGPRKRFIKQVGRREIAEGETFAHLAWPRGDFAPANEAAERVCAYYRANAANSDLLSSPWCEYRRSLFLPDIGPPQTLTTRAYPDGS